MDLFCVPLSAVPTLSHVEHRDSADQGAVPWRIFIGSPMNVNRASYRNTWPGSQSDIAGM